MQFFRGKSGSRYCVSYGEEHREYNVEASKQFPQLPWHANPEWYSWHMQSDRPKEHPAAWKHDAVDWEVFGLFVKQL